MPDADLLADEIVREFLAMGADLDQAAEVISRTRYLGAPEVRGCEPPEVASAAARIACGKHRGSAYVREQCGVPRQ